MFIPDWLKPLLAEREWLIVNDPKCFTSNAHDPGQKDSILPTGEIILAGYGDRLPPHQQHIADPKGNYFTIDSQRRMIIG